MGRRRTLGYATVAVLRAVRDGRRYGLDIVTATGLNLVQLGGVEVSVDDGSIVYASMVG